MNRFKFFALPAALLIWLGTNMFFAKTNQELFAELQEEKADIVVNYAVDAAVDEMVQESLDLGMDYADYEYVRVDPETALNMFCTVYLKGTGMTETESNMSLVRSKYIKVFMVAAYDGYYVAEPVAINNKGAYDCVFSMKQPYTYEVDIKEGNNYRYTYLCALNMGYDYCRALKYNKNNTGSGVSIENIRMTKTDRNRNEILSKDGQSRIINAVISDALMETVWKQRGHENLSTIFVPKDMTKIVRTNAVKDITVIAYMSDIPVGFHKTTETFGIGGTKVTHQRYVIGYKDIHSGQKLYTYADKYLDSYGKIIEVFNTEMEAAQAGYYFDYRTLESVR